MILRGRKAKLAAAGVLAAVAVGGGASIAAAAGGAGAPPPVADQQQAEDEHGDNPDGGPGSQEEDPAITGSVPAPAEAEQPDREKTGQSDTQERAALQQLATVTQQQAEQAALAAVSGNVQQTDLDAENGYVVYSVELRSADGTVTEVVVDAGTGQLLAQQTDVED
jgi:uncharacterized membrane protein YkoI